jgi:DNA-binding GntR family transcriptional regulator
MESGRLRELTSDTLADQAYRAIHQAIAVGELRRGEKVTERDLAARLSVSPTPVREALRRLEQDHLVERVGPRTLRVTDFPVQTLTEVAQIEVSLRVHAVRFAAAKATPDLLARLEEILAAADSDRTLLEVEHEAGRDLDPEVLTRLLDHLRRFHDTLEAACDNPVLLRLLEQTRAFSRTQRLSATRMQLILGLTGPQERYDDHRAVLDAVRAGDAEAAAELVRRHTEAAAAALLDWR